MINDPEKFDAADSVATEVRVCMDAYARGDMNVEVLTAALKGFAHATVDAGWEVLSLLDQYHRRGTLSDEVFRALKGGITHIAFTARAESPTKVRKSHSPGNKPAHAKTGRSSPAVTPNEPIKDPDKADAVTTETRDALKSSPANAAVETIIAISSQREPRRINNELPESVAPSPSRDAEMPRTTKQLAIDHSLAPGRVLHDRFVIESALSFGQSAAVFRARDRYRISDTFDFLALKLLLIHTPETSAQFEREYRIGQQLIHPHIVKALEIDRDADLQFFTMELVEGRTLGELLELAPPKRAQAWAILAQLTDAFAYLHKHSVAHGDLKPDNVMLSEQNEVRLLDFGAANHYANNGGIETKTLASNFATPLNTAIYASCERLTGLPADPRDDIFSLSCIAYELLAGQHPFRRMQATQAREAYYELAPIADLSPHQWRSLQQGLAWQRSGRGNSVREWFAGLSGTSAVDAQGLPPAREAITAPPRPREAIQPKRRSWWRWPTTVAAVFSLVAAFIIMQSEVGSQLRSLLTTQVAQPVESTRIAPTSTSQPLAMTTNTAAETQKESLLDAPTSTPGETEALASSSPSTPSTADTPQTIEPKPAETVAPAALQKESVSAQPENTKVDKITQAHGKIGFAKDTFMVNQHDAAARITINRQNGTAGQVTFTWWAESGTAEEGKDFASFGRKTEVLENGARQMTVFVPLIVDASNKDRHVFFVELGNPSNGLGLGRITRARVIISDE